MKTQPAPPRPPRPEPCCVAGLGAGVALGLGGSASADARAGLRARVRRAGHASSRPEQSQRSDEKLLTGTTAAKVKAAALAKYPGATIERVETDSDGVYEAHIVTKAGDQVIVQVDKDFAVTGTQTGGGHRRPRWARRPRRRRPDGRQGGRRREGDSTAAVSPGGACNGPTHDDDVQGARAVHALDPVELDVAGGGRAR